MVASANYRVVGGGGEYRRRVAEVNVTDVSGCGKGGAMGADGW